MARKGVKGEPLIWTPGQDMAFDWRHLESTDREHHPGAFRSLRDFQEQRMRHLPTEQVRQTTPNVKKENEQ